MTTVWDVATEAEVGDRIKWVGEDADVDNPRASTVTRIIPEEGKITVEADGPNGAEVSFWVKRDGTSMVFHQGTEQGPVAGIELPDKDIGTRHFPD